MHHEPRNEKLTRSRTSALIVGQSESLRESLPVLLRAIPQIKTVHQAEDGPSALAMEPEIHPALVLLDYELPDDELRTTLSQLKAAWPRAHLVVLLDDEHDHRLAADAGGDVILVKGTRAATVLETIEGLLSEDDPSLGSARGGRSKHGNL